MTVAKSLHFLKGQASFIQEGGFEVHAITAPGPELAAFSAREGVAVHAVPMTRQITPLSDVRSLWHLWRLLRELRPDVVHAHTPKAGLLGMIAARLAGTPARVYHLRGLPLLTARGSRRAMLAVTERVSCALAHRVIAVSHSMRRIAVAEGLCTPDKITVLAGGSGNGVDATGRFRPQPPGVRAAARAAHGIPADALVIGFVGRLVRDKGVVELAEAWSTLRAQDPRLHLLLVGALEDTDPLPEEVVAALRSDPRVHLTGHDWETPPLYAAMDVVALPTYREGFPNVALEAAAMALPIVATAVPGCVDAVVDGVTGLLVPRQDATTLAEALRRYTVDSDLRSGHGTAARRRALEDFRQEAIWHSLAAEYHDLLQSTTRRDPYVAPWRSSSHEDGSGGRR